MSDLVDAVKRGDIEAARAILARDPGAAIKHSASEESAIQEACYRGNAEMIALVSAQVDPDVFEAITLGNDGRALALIDERPELADARSYDGWTPLHLAAFFGRGQVVRALLDRDANLDALSTNYMANTPLHAAIAGPCVMDLVRDLLQAGANPNARGATGYTPFHLAASRGNRELVDLLLACGADCSLLLDDGKSAVDVARDHGKSEMADYLGTMLKAKAPSS
jgi:ankyrin repeat protein